jgi:uncharacterized protein YcbX
MALVQLDRAIVDRTGIPGDRAFALIDDEDRLVNGKRIGGLARIVPEFDPSSGRLELAFPDGRRVTGLVDLGSPALAWFFGRQRPVRPVAGPWSGALTEWAGHPLRLVALAEPGNGADRGPTTTLLSTAALTSLAVAGGHRQPLDPRRFRMTFGIDGVDAHAEDAWLDRDVRVGGGVVRVVGNVGRCAVTTHDPDSGRPSFDTLRVLNETRGMLPTTEPLPFGVWAEVIEPGEVTLGDSVGPA